MKVLKSAFIILVISLLILKNSECQVKINRSNIEFTLQVEQDSIYRILSFYKDKDSVMFTSVKYSISNFNQNSTKKELSEEVKIIDKLWDIAADSIQFNLQSFNIGYPLLYSDVVKKYINTFINSNEWQEFINQNGKQLNYKLMKSVMLKNDVYESLNDLLKTKGYYISEFITEKHGFITSDKLQEQGFDKDEIIPMPFIVWARLKRL